MGFSESQIEEIRDRADPVDLIGRRVRLKKTGNSHVGLCPFHGERTPSFNVVPQKRIWHCFGCSETGDIFKFYMKLDGLSFPDAVRRVAAEAGIMLVEEKDDPQAAARRAHEDRLAELLDRAAKFYEEKLSRPGGRIAREHLEKRGIAAESVRRFRLGFGGRSMDELSRALQKAGVATELAVEAGLCIASARGPFDRFHGRLIIPIRVPRPPDGRVVALGGRHLEGVEAPRPGHTPAKYINSPESPLYRKGHVLYGLELARDAVRKEGRAVVVEGYFDVIGLHQEGFPLAVAACGTALSEAHLDLLARAGTKELVFLFDGDAAGVRAATRAAELCAKAQMPARIASLPGGMDPDEFARDRGLAALQALVTEARPAVERLIDKALEGLGPAATVEERVRAVHAVAGIVRNAPAGLSRDLYVGQIAARLGVPESAVREALDAPGRAAPPGGGAKASGRGRPEADPMEMAVPEPTRPAVQTPGPVAAGAGQAPRAAGATLARRTQDLQEAIAVALLKFPQLSGVVAQEGLLAEFTDAELRALAEKVIGTTQEGGAIDPPSLIAGVGTDGLRRSLGRKLAAADGSFEDWALHLGRLLDRLRQEILREEERALIRAQQRGEIGAEQLRAAIEDKQRRLEEHRRIQQRIRGRGGPGKP